MNLLVVTDWIQILGIALGGGTLSILGKAVLDWLRYRKIDRSDKGKVEAETEKIKMEALQIKAQAEVTVSEAALKLVQRITDDCEEIRKNITKLETQLEGIQEELRAEKDKNIKLLDEIAQLKKINK